MGSVCRIPAESRKGVGLSTVVAVATDYRAMCAELVDALENARRIIDGADGTLHINTAEFVLRRARALLDQPEQVAHQDKLDRLIALDRDEPDRWATNAQ